MFLSVHLVYLFTLSRQSGLISLDRILIAGLPFAVHQSETGRQSSATKEGEDITSPEDSCFFKHKGPGYEGQSVLNHHTTVVHNYPLCKSLVLPPRSTFSSMLTKDGVVAMSRFRAHSDPSSPSASPSATSSSRLPNPFFSAQIHHPQPHPLASSRPVPRPTQSSQSASRSILLTSEALAALAIAESSASTTPDPSPSPGTGYQNTNWSTRGNEHYDIPRSGHGGGRRRSVTPSTTSVSDGEEEGYEEAQDARSGAKEWMNRKGKDKATERSYSGQGSGMAGSLPEEVLMHVSWVSHHYGWNTADIQIFRQVPPRDLPNMLLVSRTWCLSAFPLLWARPSPTSIPALANLVRVIVTPPESLSLPYPSYIRRVNLSSIASEVTDDLFSPFKICTRMERITMVGATKISALTLRAVVDCMPDLVALDLSNAGNMDDGVLKVIAGRCPRLQGFNLSGCKSVGDEGMKAIAGECKMLRRVSQLSGRHFSLTEADLGRSSSQGVIG